MKYGRWETIGNHWSDGKNRVIKAICECGKIKNVRLILLEKGHSLSCGCLSRELSKDRESTHGMTGTRIHNIWRSMKQRCYNINATGYERYGGKGVQICDEWKHFEYFMRWSFANGYEEDLTIDRIDSNGNYEPSNCEWVTLSENVKRMHRNNNKYRSQSCSI